MMQHTTHTVAVMLRDPDIEKEDELDLWSAIMVLPTTEQAVVRLYAQGYSPTEAVKRLQLNVNPHRTFVRGLHAIRDTLNGISVPTMKGEERQ